MICITKHLHLRDRSCYSAQPCIKPSAQPCIKMHAAGLGKFLAAGLVVAKHGIQETNTCQLPNPEAEEPPTLQQKLASGLGGRAAGLVAQSLRFSSVHRR